LVEKLKKEEFDKDFSLDKFNLFSTLTTNLDKSKIKGTAPESLASWVHILQTLSIVLLSKSSTKEGNLSYWV
jgi:hypothetical protein